MFRNPADVKETLMERFEDVIDLGTATVETKGPVGINGDDVLREDAAGLSDD